MSVQKRNVYLDIVRCLAFPLILFIHCPFPGDASELIENLGRFAVPFFLLLSGWFSWFSNEEAIIRHIKKKLVDTLRLVALFLLFYTLMNSIVCIIQDRAWYAWITPYCTDVVALELLFYNRALFLGSTGYYPLILIYVYLIFMLVVKCHLRDKIFPLIPILLAVTVVLAKNATIPWYIYGNYFLTGLPFFMLGHWLHSRLDALPKSNALWFTWLLGGILLTLLEAHYINNAYCFLGSIFIAVSVLMLCVNAKPTNYYPAFLTWLIHCSIYVFIIHCGIRDILRAFFRDKQWVIPETLFPLLVLFLSLFLGAIFDLISQLFKKHKLLRQR